MKKDLKTIREEKGMSIEEVAYKLGTTSQTIYNWERGDYKPRAATVLGLAYVLGCKAENIIFLSDVTK